MHIGIAGQPIRSVEAQKIKAKVADADPKRRRFTGLRNSFEDFAWIGIIFNNKHITVYAKVNQQRGAERIKQILGEKIEINEWRDGISVILRHEDDFYKFAKWLDL